MNIPKLENPFLVYGYEGPEYFCDREQETQSLISDMRNGWNITLVSPRRMGKTGLIKNAFYEIEKENKDCVCIYVDIFGTNCLHDFVQLLGAAMLNAMMRRSEKFIHKIAQLFSSWRPVISPDPITGAPSLSVTTEPTETEYNLKSIFNYLKSSGKEIYLAIDEFQQIMEYPEKGTEAELRTYVQFVHNVHFIFSGSKQHLMTEMFMSPRRPFFQSTRLMELKRIDETPYYNFAQEFFLAKGGSISRDVFHALYETVEGHTWYIQSILKVLYANYGNVDDLRQLQAAINEIINTSAAYYSAIMPLLTDRQQEVVRAIAKEGIVSSPTSGAFIEKYHLKSASTIKSALSTLIKKEIVYRRKEGYMVYDRFFSRWLREGGY